MKFYPNADDPAEALYIAAPDADPAAWLTRLEQTYGDHTEVWSVMNAEIATWVGYYPYAATHYLCLICPGETACVHTQAVQAARAGQGAE